MKQFSLIQNRINKFVFQAYTVLPPHWINSAGIWSVSGSNIFQPLQPIKNPLPSWFQAGNPT